MLVRELQDAKAKSPIVVTLLGIFMLVRDMHPSKAPLPIVVTLFEIFMLVRDLQSLKAPLPIVVTLFGIFMLVRKPQNSKALSPITFTSFLIEYLPFKLLGALSNFFPSLLYSTPNSSSTAFSRSSSVTSVLHTFSSFGFSTPNNLNEHIDKFFLALANRNIDRRVFVSSSANKPCRAVMVLLLLKSRLSAAEKRRRSDAPYSSSRDGLREMAFSERAMEAKAKSSMVSSKSSMVRRGCEKSLVPIVGDF